MLNESLVWRDGENGMARHFVYALTVTPKGTLLAMTEARLEMWDEAPHHLVLKRSWDGGKTWSPETWIERGDHGECWMNPTLLIDALRGRIFAFYALNEGRINGHNTQRKTRVFTRCSDDDGATWGPRTEITNVLKVRSDGSPNLDPNRQPAKNEDSFDCDALGRAFHLPGPGHGIQLQNGPHPGRLLMQFWHRRRAGSVDAAGVFHPEPLEARRYGVSVLLSDDGGHNWRSSMLFGEEVPVTEARLTELPDGSILFNGRVGSGPNAQKRWQARSFNGGQSWSDGHFAELSPAYPSDAGLVAVGNTLILSRPAALNGRSNFTIYGSVDGGAAWPHCRELFAGGAEYSDLTALPDETLGVLYGRSRRPVTGQDFGGQWCDEVAFTCFDLDWLCQ